MRKTIIYSLLLASLLLVQTSCHQKRSDDAREVYQLWAGEAPPANVKVLKGKYWQSAHFNKEYIVYMELVAPRAWIEQFIEQNNLKTGAGDREIPEDAPDWFRPSDHDTVWTPSGFSQGSKYFIDSAYTHMFLYEVEL